MCIRDRPKPFPSLGLIDCMLLIPLLSDFILSVCLLYTSDAADDSLRVDLGGRRIIKKNHSDKKVLSDNYIWNFLKPWLNKSEAIIERKTIYTFESAIARKWRKGRVFIAGDAAHLMPPFMGQGMCAGIRDASNLAWKIANCIRNKFDEKLLNTYQSERSLNVKNILKPL